MDNRQLADALGQFADLMEIQGKNAFRVNAYRRAADTVAGLAEPVSELVAEDRLTELPGIGAGIAASLKEIEETSSFAALDELLDQIPATLLTMLAIPGVGPKTVGRLYRELSITNLQELELAASAGRVSQLKGLGKRQEQRMLEGIAFLYQRTGRTSIGAALPEARSVKSLLAERLGARVELAGSVRRMTETVGNIDLIVEDGDVDSSAAVLASEVGSDTFERDARVLTAMLPSGIELRVVASPPQRFGTDWVRLTGSASHVEQLLERLGPDLPAARDEIEVYRAAGLEWIPPELREASGEIEAASDGLLPSLITVEDMRGDLHLHSDWSDGRATILELAHAARDLGYEYLSISDHSHSLAIARGLDRERLQAQRAHIDEINVQVPEVRLLRACEVEVRRDGTLDFPDEVLAELDLVVASLHSGLSMGRDALTERIIRVIENPHVDIVAHPTGRIIEQRPGAEYHWERVFEAAARTETALEINANPARLDLSDRNARAAAQAGVLITINSDAHDLGSLPGIGYGVAVARRAWLTSAQVVNTFKLEQLLTWLGR
jgi:DNA polymerase (family X)